MATILRQRVAGRVLDEPLCALSGDPISTCGCGGQHCRSCGCTDMATCAEGCYWIGPGLCSACDDWRRTHRRGVA